MRRVKSLERATYIAATLLKPPFTTSYSLVQKDVTGKVIVDLRW